MLIGLPLLGLAGTLLGWHGAVTTRTARHWLAMLWLLAAAFALSLLVQRAGALAHGCALPGLGPSCWHGRSTGYRAGGRPRSGCRPRR